LLEKSAQKKAWVFSSHFLENSAKAGCTCSVLGNFTGSFATLDFNSTASSIILMTLEGEQ